jgi:hypothetical protein
MATVAFKEWAVICRALADGRQSLILRKGGIAETGGDFRPEHHRFLLLPTYFHEQHRTGIKPEYLPLLDAAESARPPAGTLRFTHLAEVTAVRKLTDLAQALALDPAHGWTLETVRQRFHYRTPGLFVMTVRVSALTTPVEVPDRADYAGCKTWVDLTDDVPTDGAKPVMTGAEFADYSRAVEAALSAVKSSSS